MFKQNIKDITIADTDKIEEYKDIAKDFLNNICNTDYNECFISDESCLSDFAGCCFPEDFDSVGMTLTEFYARGKEFAVAKVKEKYGIDVDVNDYFITIFEKIKQQQYMRSQ
jgi:hypothetical protein